LNVQPSLERDRAFAVKQQLVERNPLRGVGGSGTAVFVVDGDSAFASLVTEHLEGGGYAAESFTSGEAALAAARTHAPALVVLEVNLPGVSGYEVCRLLRDMCGDGVGIIFVSGERTEPFDRVAGLLVGADDYIVKPVEPDELLARVRGLLRRIVPIEPAVERAGDGHPSLTPREQEVLALLASGKRQRDIAGQLVISPKTVATHIQRILAKLHVHSRAEAVAVAHLWQLVPKRSSRDGAASPAPHVAA
jgi:DNA-binding NarL/FixJ family response regulator